MSNPVNVLSAKAALDNNYVLVLTTNSVERTAVDRLFQERTVARIEHPHNGSTLGRIGNRFCLHLTGEAGAQGDKSIGRLARHVTGSFLPKPALVVIVGFAWGNPAKVAPGEVVISREVWAINRVRMTEQGEERLRIPRESPLGDLSDQAERLLEMGVTGVRAGILASCETYFSQDEARDRVLAQYPEVMGGEMEAYDFVADLGVPWFLIKGISDDAGNGVNRDRQRAAAAAAADLLLPLIGDLESQGAIPPPTESWDVERLTDAVIGQAIRISPPSQGRDAITDYINDNMGPRIVRRLCRYTSDADADGGLPECLGVLIMEIAQNALVHGGASHVTCAFTETSVTVSDDGRPFDLTMLAGKRGGAIAWDKFRKRYPGSELIDFTQSFSERKGNHYSFKMKKLSKAIRDARENCMLVSSGEYGRKLNGRFVFNADCEWIYYDATELYMRSKSINVTRELCDLLDNGKGLFIACRNQDQVQDFEGELSQHAGPNLRVFVASRV
ncbi:hypothetical protein [Bosea sp. BIWAKO-01]|uniref:phosphorylase family protein n=1 Tax=Bosea sp. BIWAKO-01 TaxID=506668 RepID=UPI000853E3E8|nr:hypothetical protein [Bosea sp. BIWAKO-01]GAU80249.1 hypothetical protein BIWAKO_00135 [Bosea sp. BIWAKO-01]